MRLAPLLLFAFILTGSLAHAQQQVSSAPGRWSIQIPRTLTRVPDQKVPISTDIGEVTMNMTMAQNKEGSSMVMVAWCDYPLEIFGAGKNGEGEIDAMFDSARQGGLRNIENSRLLSEEKIDLDGLPGRSIRFTGVVQGQPVYARFDYYIDVPRLYQIGYISMNEASVGSAEVRRIFTSFAVTPKQTNTRSPNSR